LKSAEKFHFELFKLLETLKKYPERGRTSQKSNEIRILNADDHNFILYEVIENEIHIHNVLPYNMDHSSATSPMEQELYLPRSFCIRSEGLIRIALDLDPFNWQSRSVPAS
jgi:hypothetical protein